jgi:hypothetical protein
MHRQSVAEARCSDWRQADRLQFSCCNLLSSDTNTTPSYNACTRFYQIAYACVGSHLTRAYLARTWLSWNDISTVLVLAVGRGESKSYNAGAKPCPLNFDVTKDEGSTKRSTTSGFQNGFMSVCMTDTHLNPCMCYDCMSKQVTIEIFDRD